MYMVKEGENRGNTFREGWGTFPPPQNAGFGGDLEGGGRRQVARRRWLRGSEGKSGGDGEKGAGAGPVKWACRASPPGAAGSCRATAYGATG